MNHKSFGGLCTIVQLQYNRDIATYVILALRNKKTAFAWSIEVGYFFLYFFLSYFSPTLESSSVMLMMGIDLQ